MSRQIFSRTQDEQPEKLAGSSQAADLFACAGGLVTSLLTGVLLWWVAVKFGVAIHKFTYWFVLPVGAFFSGWAGASGYYLVYQVFQRRPGRLLLPNISRGFGRDIFLD